MNNLYQQLNGNNIMSRFEEFKKTFNGDPQETVQKLLNSGQMSQEQFNQLSQQAKQLQQLLGK